MSNIREFTPTADLDAVILVCRSHLDPDVWVCVPTNMVATDHASLLSPGRLRAVKRHAEACYGNDEPVRWTRRDHDTWVMQPA